MPKDWRIFRVPQIVASNSVAFALSTAAPAAATQMLPTEITASGATPVRIDSCRAAMVDKAGAAA